MVSAGPAVAPESLGQRKISRWMSPGTRFLGLRLPENIEGEPAAELKDGILTLTFKLQLPEEKKPEVKKIPIQMS